MCFLIGFCFQRQILDNIPAVTTVVATVKPYENDKQKCNKCYKLKAVNSQLKEKLDKLTVENAALTTENIQLKNKIEQLENDKENRILNAVSGIRETLKQKESATRNYEASNSVCKKL